MRNGAPVSIYASTLTRRGARRRRSRRRRVPYGLLLAYAALVPLAVAAAERLLG